MNRLLRLLCPALALYASSAFSLTWADLRGCYKTETFNGSAVADNESDHGSGRENEKFSMATLPDGTSVRSMEFFLFEYKRGDTNHYGWVAMLPDLGTTEMSADSLSWSFDGPLRYSYAGVSQPFTLKSRVDIRDLGNGRLEIHNQRTIPEIPDRSFDADDVYVIRRDTRYCSALAVTLKRKVL